MDLQKQDVPGYFVWESPGEPVKVHVKLDLVDRLAADVMRGFGALPRRGAEVGGILLGSIEPGDPSVVHIEDYQAVACEYRTGPSYLFTTEERSAFADAVAQHQPDFAQTNVAVGFYRGHTRDAMALAPEDLELLAEFFPSASHVALLVKPFATQACQGALFVRHDGAFPAEPSGEFPFRRRELSGEPTPPRRPLQERRPRERKVSPFSSVLSLGAAAAQDFPSAEPEPEPVPETRDNFDVSALQRPRRSPWMAISFVFLVLGAVLGGWAALTLAPQMAAGRELSNLALKLAASPTGDSITVRWNRDSTGVRNASRAVLEIEDGEFSKRVELRPSDLRSGTLIYQNATAAVRFRLVVYVTEGLELSETIRLP